ncbi:fungal zn(2)-Cys(6) binuclear cluster domain-containing protein [Purpureocillium lavendulum]|uniref:Fungal zn(2)-Cys(6) binuclear cluster domain-containing protein n=1 Tax=Purpureocillium lavendulum TaxID=1247861 RepID=A0AB34FW14_9HYPO|nr:fungal zn(2)-Cys(6) binuclear cluster domain-containing protein [Purpureocillium lavendulum]
MPTRPPPEYTDDPGTLLDETADSLSELSKCKLDADLRAAAKDLSNFIHNVRHLSRDYQSRDDQLCAMFPIRNWLRFVPRAPDKFAAGGDFKLYLYLANYETTMLIMGSILPWVELPLAIPERWTCVEKIREFLQSQVDSIVDGDDIAGAAQTYKAYTNWMGVAEKVMNQHHFD